jgi:predicted transcriptional regulator
VTAAFLGVFWLLAAFVFTADRHPLLNVAVFWLAINNGILLAFNSLPLFPLDGGRVLRAVLWSYGHEKLKATQISYTISLVLCYGMIAFGIYLIVAGNILTGIWLILISCLIKQMGQLELQQLQNEALLQDVTVGEIMSRHLVTVPFDMLVTDLQNVAHKHRLSAFPVLQGGAVVGIVSLTQIGKSMHEHQVRDIMTPIHHVVVVLESTKVSQVQPSSKILVVDSNNVLQGMLTVTDIIRELQYRRSTCQLGVPSAPEITPPRYSSYGAADSKAQGLADPILAQVAEV